MHVGGRIAPPSAHAAAALLLVSTLPGLAGATSAFPYRLVEHAQIPALLATTGPEATLVLERLNRADRLHLPRLEVLLVPDDLDAGALDHAPFPRDYETAAALPKLLVVDLAWQAFAGYEHGRLVHWGPVSSGRRTAPTPSGAFHLTWKSPGRRSTVNPRWFMPWYFNFANRRGLALHAYALEGRPASHACVRLLVEDARWLYGWGEQWTLGPDGRTVATPGTPLLVHGTFDFDRPPPWLSGARLATGADLPAALPFDSFDPGRPDAAALTPLRVAAPARPHRPASPHVP